MGVLTNGNGSAKHSLIERGNDLYETPEVATRALLAAEKLPPVIWEPACGYGAISSVLVSAGHQVYSTDLVNYGYGAVRDFLKDGDYVSCDAIVTNPPFKDAMEFVKRAMDRAPLVIMLLRLAFIESERRRPILDNGRLARVHVFRNRLPMMHRDGWQGNKVSNPTAFAWFVWDRNHEGPTTLNRISWVSA